MIVKIKTRKKPSFRQLLDYMLNDKDRLYDKQGRSFVITHNLKGKSIDQWERQFKDNEQYRKYHRKGNVMLYHEILSWHREDAKDITLDKLEEMAREYISLRNPNGMYVAVPHFDKEHYHIHICTGALEYHSGNTLRMSREEFARLKKDIQKYQQEKYPELGKSIVKHGKKEKAKLTEKEYQLKRRTGRQTHKEELAAILEGCYEKAASTKDFFEKVKDAGLKTYERGGEITGVIYKGQKFRLKRVGFGKDTLLHFGRYRDADLQKIRRKKRDAGREI